MNFKSLLSIILCFIHFMIFCQPSLLLNDLKNTKDTLVRMDIFIELSQEYLFIDSEKSIEFAKKGWEIAIFNNVSTEKKHTSIHQLGKAYSVFGDYNQAIHIFKEALTENDITDSIKIEYYNSLGIINYKIEDYPNALLFSQKAIHLSDSLNIPDISIASIGTAAAIYKKQKKYNEALETLNKSLDISLKSKDKNQSKILAYAYKDISFVQMKLNQMDEALIAVHKAIDIAQQNGYLYIESEARNNLSKIHLNLSNIDEATIQAVNAKKLAQKVNANKLIVEANTSLLECYLDSNQLQKAEALANETLDIATELDLKAEIIYAYQYISKIASKNNEHKKAYEIQLEIASLLDQRFEKEKQQQFKLTEEKVKRVKEDALIQKIKDEAQTDKMNLKKSKAFGIIMSIFFFLALLLCFILYRYGLLKHQFSQTSFFKNEEVARLQFISKAAFLAMLFVIPIILYFYIWEIPMNALFAGIPFLVLIGIQYFAKQKKLNLIFFLILTFYFLVAISPAVTGTIFSNLLSILTIFLALFFLKPQFNYQIINLIFAVCSASIFFYLAADPSNATIPYSADLELLQTAANFILIIVILFHFFKNINDYKEELIKKNNFLNQISDINPHLVFAKDKNRRYTFANQILSDKYKIPKENFIGKQYEEFDNHDQNWAAQVKEDDLNILNNGISVIGKEEKIYDLNGNPMWVSNSKKPILNAQNEVEGLLGVTIDITERKLREEHLKESENRYRQLFNLSFDGLIIVDIDGEILEINASAKNLLVGNKKEHSTKISDYFPTIHELTDLKKFHQSQIHFGPLSRVDGKNESNEMIPLELNIFKIPYFGETKIAFAFKNISTQLILQKKEQEIENLNKEFVSQEIFANTKNKLLSEIKNDVAEIIPHIDGKGKQELHKLIRKIGGNINDEENFFSFKLKFEKSHPDFFNTLNHLYPKLTNNDLKLCAYMRLGMTSLDIANLQFIERKSVEMSKYRLKKKLQLESKDDLNTFIHEI